MTWIVGKLTPFGLGIVASDIRVTLGDKTEMDCLQKIYPVGGGILAGFAGSVKIGFSLLQAFADESVKLPKDKAWNLNVISNTWWPRIARRVFSLADNREQNLKSQIILVGTHPNKNQGPFPQIEMFTFSSPDFRPTKELNLASIGCGTVVQHCKRFLEEKFTRPDPEFLMLFQAGPLALAAAVGSTLQVVIRENPVFGISQLFQVGAVGRGYCQFFQNEIYFNNDGTLAPFPEVVRDYPSLIRLCEKNQRSAVAAVC